METLIFDKSFIQTLNTDELFELDVFFELVNTPILRKEILADLEKKSTEERNELSVVKSLCAKMSRSGLEPMEYRNAALHELNTGRAIPLHGAMLMAGSSNGTGGDGQRVPSQMKNVPLPHRTVAQLRRTIQKLCVSSGDQQLTNTSVIVNPLVKSLLKLTG